VPHSCALLGEFAIGARFRCCDNTNGKCQRVFVLTLCLVQKLSLEHADTRPGPIAVPGSLQSWNGAKYSSSSILVSDIVAVTVYNVYVRISSVKLV